MDAVSGSDSGNLVLLATIAVLLLSIVFLLTSKAPPPPPPAVIAPPVYAPPAQWQTPGFGWTPPKPDPKVHIEDMLKQLALSPPSAMAPSMEEVVESHKADKHKTPDEVLQELKAGNARFWTGTAQRPELSAMERRSLIVQQEPKVAVVGCADSRVPVEIVLDQGLGDVFVMRGAGNLYSDTTAGSLDYAVHKLSVPLVVVMGHEGCGAVTAAMKMSPESLDKEPPMLRALIQRIKEALSQRYDALTHIVDNRARDREAVCTVVRSQVKKVLDDPRIAAKVADGSLKVVGAFYEISSGLVDFFQYSENDLNHI